MRYFVESLPETCEYCDCCHTRLYDNKYKIDGEKFCGVTNEDVEIYYYHGDGRPEWCPLRKTPEMTLNEFPIGTLSSSFVDGWNSCVCKMTGDAK